MDVHERTSATLQLELLIIIHELFLTNQSFQCLKHGSVWTSTEETKYFSEYMSFKVYIKNILCLQLYVEVSCYKQVVSASIKITHLKSKRSSQRPQIPSVPSNGSKMVCWRSH